MDTQVFVLDLAAKIEIIQRLSDKLKAFYIFPDIAEQICSLLQKYLRDGEYTHITNGKVFSNKLTKQLQELNHDEHLWVKWHSEPLPDEEEALRLNPEWQAERMLEARLDNYGFHKLERLPGNVGYIDIHYFHRPAWAGDTASAAMNFIANTHALIIDLRTCTGGYPGTISLVCSYLFGEEPVHLTSIYWRDDDLTQQYWTLPYVPGKRFTDKPVYALIGTVTFSGGEAFASILQSRQRATLIGAKTDGGAHPGASYRIHPYFEVFIPTGRTINPVTGTDWEGSGILPDILVPEEQAFSAAYRMALESIVADLGAAPSGAYKAVLEEAQIALIGLENQ
jgi:retinol-binding protein 3